MFALMLESCCFDNYSFVVSFEIGRCESSTFVLKIILTIHGPLRFHMNFRMDFSFFSFFLSIFETLVEI